MSVLYNLRIRKLVNNTLCPVCKREEETVSHIVRDCSFTRQVSRELGCSSSTCNRETNWNFWLASVFEHLTEEECTKRTILLWAIWHNRNKMYHEGCKAQVHEAVGFINAYYAEIVHKSEVLKSRNEICNKTLQPPRGDRIKINFDAVFNNSQHKSVSGIIARNNDGKVMASCTYLGVNMADPTTTEARSCLQAVNMAEELGFQEVDVEGDVLTVI
ncbi:uncharacterized protein LOC108455303 [Gossypium arboreum]|uniref:uncharacterized protein LOC108455303 n=1 Tax=Gossypium arboreum TaxID=29729 RepID=UPI0008196CB4|nr:uncharacterized protein LOC108455303 [Gossypium arboreum]